MTPRSLPVSTLVIDRTGRPLARVEVAATPSARRQGLLGRDRLESGRGMILTPCSSIHTWFMRFAIDVVFLDRRGRIVKIVPNVRPFRMRWGGWRACDTVELQAGALAQSDLRVGDLIRVDGT